MQDSTDKEILDRADEADEVRREVVSLREEKERKLASDQPSDGGSSDATYEQYITGSLESVDRDGLGNVTIETEYMIDGKVESESFNMKLPEDPEDYSVDNEYVRLRSALNVSENETIMGRDIPLKVSKDNTVSIDIPDKPTKIGMSINKAKRGIRSSNIYRSLKETNGTISAVGSFVITGILIMSSLVVLLNAQSQVGNRFLVDLFVSAFIIGLPFVGSLRLEEIVRDRIDFHTLVGVIGSVMIFVMASDGMIRLVWLSNEYTILMNFVTMVSYGFATFCSVCAYYHLGGWTGPLGSWGINKISEWRDRIQRWRGVEFVD